MSRDDSVYLRHILDAIAKIEEYLSDLDEDGFHRDYLVQDGVIRRLEIIGEATKNLSSTLRTRYAYVPWKDVAGMRDKLIHHYFGVDLEAVWSTATTELPDLRANVNRILEDL